MRGVTSESFGGYSYSKFQLTRLMRGVTVTQVLADFILRISTHTPHARRDSLLLAC